MQIQLTRKRIVNAVLIGAMTLTVGGFHIQPAAAQVDRSAFREAARELNLSRSQMQSVGGIMQSFNAEIQEILTPEQVELLQSAREEQQSQSQAQDPQELQAELNLTETQSEQLAVAREEMVTELQGVLTPEQVEGLMEMTGF
ncbi:MAG: hypothetical protein AAF215_13190 [Cyanobacteria bacterium P01_A01_bin.123]